MALREDILACRACSLWDAFKRTVPFEGNLHAELMFVGRDPGREEIAQLRPFIGPAGQVFRNDVLAPIGIPEASVYISNIVCCRPVGNIAPGFKEASFCASRHVFRAIAEVQPKVIVTLGKEAADVVMGVVHATIGGIRGRTFKTSTGIPVIPTWHPSYVLRLQSINPVDAEFRRNQMISDIKVALEYCQNLKSVV